MSKKTISNLTHKLLVAMPHIKDDLFEKSVIYVYEHDAQGAMAFVVNKPLPITLGDILRQLSMKLTSEQANDIFLLQGGPVSKEQLYVIQFNPENPQEELKLAQPQELLSGFAEGKNIDNSLALLGYAGWHTGQLEKELINNDWIICPFHTELFTDCSAEKRWEQCFKKIGIDPFYISENTGHA